MNTNSDLLALTDSLLKTCDSNGRSMKLFMKKGPCKKALGSLLLHLGLGEDPLVKRLNTNGAVRLSHGEYTTLRFRLTIALRKELGMTKGSFVLGDSASTVIVPSLRQVLLVIVGLLGCRRMHCTNTEKLKIMPCILKNCSAMLLVCMDLAVDLYTKVPCIKGFETACETGMASLKKQVETIKQKISSKKRLTKKEMDALEHTLLILTSMMAT